MGKTDNTINAGQTETELGSASDTGQVRDHNEDSLLTLELLLEGDSGMILTGLYAVADGIGGHSAGEIASSLALRTLSANIFTNLLLPAMNGDSPLSRRTIRKAFIEGVAAANIAIYEAARYEGNNMGTTLVAALVVGNTAYIVNVGDSRGYLLKGRKLRQITQDHSLVAALVAAGEITSEEIYTHPRRNIITRCLGTQKDIEVDLYTEKLKPGSTLILCSDGLWEMVRDDEIKNIVIGSGGSQDACNKLIEAANDNGGADNISVIVVKSDA